MGEIKGSLTISNFHDFLNVLKSVLLDRGFKLQEEIDEEVILKVGET